MDGRSPDAERRPAPRLLPQRLPGPERAGDPVRAGRPVLSRPWKSVNWKDLNPRLGVAYDLFGNGKTAVKASVNRYVLGEGTGRASTINPIQSNNTMSRQWTDPNGDRVVQGDPFNPALNGELGVSQNLSFGKPVISVRYDPEWSHGFQNRPYNWEFSTGVQHELMPRVSVNAAYFRRIYGNFTVTDNALVGPENYDPYCVTAPVRHAAARRRRRADLRSARSQPDQGRSAAIVSRPSPAISATQCEHWNGVDLTDECTLAESAAPGRRQHRAHCTRTTARSRGPYPEAAAAGRVNSDRFCRTAVAVPDAGQDARRLHAAVRHPVLGHVPDQPRPGDHGELDLRQRADRPVARTATSRRAATATIALVEPKTAVR